MRRIAFIGALIAVTVVASAGAGPPAVTVTVPAAFSPNGDGVRERATIVVTLATEAAVTLTVEGAGGDPVATLLAGSVLPAGSTEVRWKGRDDGGARLPDGSYRVVAVVAVGGGLVHADVAVRIDTKPPEVRWSEIPWSVGGTVLPTRFRVADAALATTVSLRLRDGAAEWESGRREFPVGPQAASWSLRERDRGRLRPGGFRVSLAAVDDAGNRGASPEKALLVEYPVTARALRRVDGAGRRVALTFDDCNDGRAWARILAVLDARGVTASFFCLGSQIARHAAEARRTLRDGHSIGNHSWNHAFLPGLSPAGVTADVRRATLAWWQVARRAPMPYYRPPYGALDADAVKGIGTGGYARIVLWDVDPQDWRRPGASAIAARATAPARAGSIILLHTLSQTAAALPEIVSRLRARGLQPVSLDRLLAAAGGG